MKRLAVILLSFPTILYAQEDWQLVDKAKNGDAYYIKSVSKKSNSNRISFWVKTIKDLKSLEEKKGNIFKPGDYMLAKWEGDCDEMTTQTKYLILYDKNGNAKQTDSGPFEELPVIPDSMGELILKSACSRIIE